jgi:N-acyl homoserine lactone hydrolase
MTHVVDAISKGCLIGVLLLTVAGCETLSGVNVGTGVSLPGGVRVGANKTIGSNGERTSPSKPKSTRPTLKLYVFDCGALYTNDISAFGLTNEDTPVRELFVPCYLLEHSEKGRLLWDAGLSPEIVGSGRQPLGEGTYQVYQRSLVDQLRMLNLRPTDIDFVAFSHMHFDHVGSANEFAGATLLIQENEYEAAFKNHQDNPLFEYNLYEELAYTTKILLNGDHDVFGDGSVKIISAPGHTPGHQALLVYLEEFGPLVLSGDLYHFEKSRELRSVPLFNTNRTQSLESMDRVEQVIKSNRATLWIEHNMALAKTLRMAPAFYD